MWLDSICQRRKYEYVKEIVTAPPTAPPAPIVVHHHHHHTTTVVHERRPRVLPYRCSSNSIDANTPFHALFTPVERTKFSTP